MKIKIKYVLYVVVAVIALAIVLNFFVLNHAKQTKYLSVGKNKE